MLSGILMIVSVVSEPVSHRVDEMDFLKRSLERIATINIFAFQTMTKQKFTP